MHALQGQSMSKDFLQLPAAMRKDFLQLPAAVQLHLCLQGLQSFKIYLEKFKIPT